MIYPLLTLIISFTSITQSCTLNMHKSNINIHTYTDVINYHIPYENLLKMQDFEYFTYIYSQSCLHCETIKYEVIEYALEPVVPLYFLLFNDLIPLSDDVSPSINQNTLFSFSILGTPTLVHIIDGYIKMNVSGSDIILSILNLYKK